MVAYDAVLVPTDGSPGTEDTLDHATTLARHHEATLHGLYVVDSRQYRAADRETKDDVIRSLEEEGERALDDVAVAAEEAGVDAQTHLADGIPTKTIVNHAADLDADVVVMGTHGRTGRQRAGGIGSVTERVVEGAHVPVFVNQVGEE